MDLQEIDSLISKRVRVWRNKTVIHRGIVVSENRDRNGQLIFVKVFNPKPDNGDCSEPLYAQFYPIKSKECYIDLAPNQK